MFVPILVCGQLFHSLCIAVGICKPYLPYLPCVLLQSGNERFLHNSSVNSDKKDPLLRILNMPFSQIDMHSAFKQLPEEAQAVYSEAIKALHAHFEPESKRVLYVAEFHMRTQKSEG